jgi:DNA polymerase III, subunits gamma and tau
VRRDPPRGSLLAASTALEDDGHRLLINLPKGSSFVTKMLDRKDVRATVEAAVRQAFGERALVYAESSLVGADIARSRAKAPAPTPARGTMVTPQPLSASQGQATSQAVSSVVPQRGPAPAPQPAMSHAAAPATAPQAEPPVEEVPLESYYDMPWDEPPAYEGEPMAPVGETSLAAEPQVASRAVPGPEPVHQTSQQVEPRTAVVFEAEAASTAESKSKPDPKPKAKTTAKTEPKQKPKPDPKPKSKTEPKPRSKPKGSQSAPKRADGMPQDMNELLAMLTEVFGDGVEASVEKLQDSAVEQN